MNAPTFKYPHATKGPDTIRLVKHPQVRGTPKESAAPWYIRPGRAHQSGKAWHSLGSADVKQAIANARTFLDSWSGAAGERHAVARATLAGPASTTIASLAADWAAAGYPTDNERPRSEAAARRLVDFLTRALTWWGKRVPAAVTTQTIREFARERKADVASRGRGECGGRTVDLELVALSCLGSWAAAVGKIERNPFADRPRFKSAVDVRHCNESRPASDDELHKILGWFWAPAQVDTRKVAGAILAWCALTGQRPGEPGELRVPHKGAAVGDNRPPGTRWRLKDGSERIAVIRSKGGINPAIRVHGTLDSFLSAWRTYRDGKWPLSPWLFPHPWDPAKALQPAGGGNATLLSHVLRDACIDLGLPERHPHGMRAFYVRVRRADGVDDAAIASELGQGSGPGLVVSTYGRNDDILGDGAFDWLPTGAPAWELLTAAAPANVVPIHALA